MNNFIHILPKYYLLMSSWGTNLPGSWEFQAGCGGIILTHLYLVNSKIPTASLGKLQRMNTVTIMQPILVRRNSLMCLCRDEEILIGIFAWIFMLITRSIIKGRMAVEKIGWKIWSKTIRLKVKGWTFLPDRLDKIWRDSCHCEAILLKKAFSLSLEDWARQRRL